MATQHSLNHFQSNRAVFSLNNFPNTSFSIQDFQIPSVNLDAIKRPTPLSSIPEPGTVLIYEPLTLTFMLNEDLSNWREIYTWMRSLAPPEDLCEGHRLPFTHSDASIIVYSSHKNPLITFKFLDCIPIDLSAVEVTELDSETIYKTANLTLEYARFDIE